MSGTRDYVLQPADKNTLRIYAFIDCEVEIVWIQRDGVIRSVLGVGANGDAWTKLTDDRGNPTAILIPVDHE